MKFESAGYHAGEQLGPYRIMGTLGAGGMGIVYLAWDTRLDRRVALKMVHRHLLADTASVKRFLREARAAARIEHPNVVRVYRIDSIGEEPAIEMEYIDGHPLSALMDSGPMPVAQVIGIMRQILTALAACHAQDIIHCDLKPGNLLVTAERQVFLADFGIARALESSAPDAATSQTRTGLAWGTPRYMPPEAWDDARPGPQWDLYAVGALIYEALAGKPAFTGETAARLMKQILTEDPPDIAGWCPDISSEFAGLVMDLLSRDPSQRPRTAQEALERLAGLPENAAGEAETQPIPRHPSARTRTPRTARLRRPLAIILLAIVGLGVFTYGMLNRNASPAPPDGDGSARESSGTARPEPFELTPSNGGVVFTYDDGIHGREMWYMSLGGEAQLIRDIVPGRRGSNPRRLYAMPNSGAVVFAATTPDLGEELWIIRPEYGETFSADLVMDIIPGPMSSEPQVFGDLSGFYAFYATSMLEGREPWLSNGHAPQTAPLGDLFPGNNGSAMMTPKVLVRPGEIYFLGLNDNGHGQVLFHYDHRAHEVQLIADVFEDAGSMALAGNTLVIANQSAEFGAEPWCYRPGQEGLQLLADINPGPGSSDPGEFTDWNGKAFFNAILPGSGKELWVSDGTRAGTRLLADINPGPEDSDPFGFVPDGNQLFFKAVTAACGRELWVTNGTAAGTRMVADIWPGAEGSGPYNLLPAGDRLFFTANDGVYGEELWVYYYKTGGVERLTDCWPGPAGSEPYEGCLIGSTTAMFKVKTPDLGPAILRAGWSNGPMETAVFPLPYRASNTP